MVLEQTLHVVLNLKEAVRLLVVGHEHVRVHFVDKDLVVEVGLDGTSLLN